MLAALREDGIRVELRFGPPAADDDPTGAVTEDVHVRVADGGEHPWCHLRRRHPELRMHACHYDVELREQVRLLVERAVFEDVDLDAGEDPKRREPFVDAAHDVELLAEPISAQPARHREPR